LHQYLLQTVKLQVSLRRVVLAKALSVFYGLLLPGDFFSGIAKWADLSAATGDKSRVLSSLVFAKIALALPPLVIGSIALLATNPFSNRSLTVAVSVISVLLITVLALALHPVTGGRIDALIGKLLQRMPDFLRLRATSVLNAFVELRSLRLVNYTAALAMSTLVFGLAILATWFAASAVSVEVPLAAFYWINLFLFVSRLLPLTVGNLGVREGILAVAFGLYGVQPAAAVLVGLLMFSSFLVIGMVGGAYQVAIANGWVEWRIGPDRR
jgi:uncharacterized membrane protein YbhN (UPF0104 family)